MGDLVLGENIETDNATWSNHEEFQSAKEITPSGYSTEEEDADTKSTASVLDYNECVGGNQLNTSIGQLNLTSCTGVHIGNQSYYHGDVTIQQYVVNAKDTILPLQSDGKGILTLVDNVIPTITEPQKEETNVAPPLKKGTVLFIIGTIIAMLGLSSGVIVPALPKQNGWDDKISENTTLMLYSREDWEALPSRDEIPPLKENPPHYVIIIHTAGSSCSSFPECSQKVRDIQMDHMERGWGDIGFQFLVGGDGGAYTGLGWGKHGAHTIPFNRRSIAIAFIGNFMFELPPKRQISAAKLLIQEGVKLGKIASDYKLFAQKQVASTLSPGLFLTEDIKSWPHWTTYDVSDE